MVICSLWFGSIEIFPTKTPLGTLDEIAQDKCGNDLAQFQEGISLKEFFGQMNVTVAFLINETGGAWTVGNCDLSALSTGLFHRILGSVWRASLLKIRRKYTRFFQAAVRRHGNLFQVLSIGFLLYFIIFPFNVYANCKPLLVMYGGGMDDKTKLMRYFSQDFGDYIKRHDVSTYYYNHDDIITSYNTIARHQNSNPQSPIALVGHSWGGDTAYRVSEELSGNIDLLVTLDAVGGVAYPWVNFSEFRKDDLRRPKNVKKWINIFSPEESAFKCFLLLGYIWDWNNCIASTGARWLRQKFAWNIKFAGDHGNLTAMFSEIHDEVEAALKCNVKVP